MSFCQTDRAAEGTGRRFRSFRHAELRVNSADSAKGETMNDDIADKVVGIIAEQAMLQPDEVKLEAKPEDLGLDSLALVEIVFAIEEEFDVSVPFNANEPTSSEFDISSVAKIIEAVRGLIARGLSADPLMARRVVVTGLGVVSALGVNRAEHFEGLREGRSGIGPLEITDIDRLSVKIGGASPFQPEGRFDKSDLAFLTARRRWPWLRRKRRWRNPGWILATTAQCALALCSARRFAGWNRSTTPIALYFSTAKTGFTRSLSRV